MAAGFLFKSEALDWSTVLFVLGGLVTVCSFLSLSVTFSTEAEIEAHSAAEAAFDEPGRSPELAAANA